MYQQASDNFARADRLLNDTDKAVKDALIGVVLQNPHLALLEIGNTIIRRDYYEVTDIKILSGGESGHDPLYSGFVGKGFLTAAIHGEIFTSPPSFHIKNVLKEITYKQDTGVLVIIQNNPGDTLNFGIAVEQAQSEGVRVMLLVVTDDCSDILPSNKTDQPRGLTGVILMQKIAAALAEEHVMTLAQMHMYCNDLQVRLSTVLLTLRECMGENENTCICRRYGRENEADIGGGLHGESGPVRITLSTVDELVSNLIQEMSKNVILDAESPFVLMVNNLRVSKFEESIFIGELLNQLFAREVSIERVYIGTFMTSLETKGFTITVLKANIEIIKYLDYPTNAPAWKLNVFPLNPHLLTTMKPRIRLLRYPRLELKGPKLSPRQSNILLLVMRFACDALISCEWQLNMMDSENGDGDTGSRIRVAAEEILAGVKVDGLNVQHLYVFFKQLSKVAEKIGGTLAALYSIMFESSANHMLPLPEETEIDAFLWLSCLFNVITSLRSHTKTEDGTHNMIAPLVDCASKTEEMMNTQCVSGLEAFCCGVAAAEEASQNTKLPGNKYPDPGAHAVSIWMRAILEGVKFRCEL